MMAGCGPGGNALPGTGAATRFVPLVPRRTAIEVRKARTHNLKGIDCRIPHGKVTVVTGPSGAGKSSLAFDTVFAEGQRRFVESMSTYARQFLDQMERPPVEAIHNILPAVALEASNTIRNARSTVGTITEVYDVLRLLFSHVGEPECPEGHGAVRRYTTREAADEIAGGVVGERVVLVAPVRRPKKAATAALRELVRQGYARRLVGDEIVRMDSKATWEKELDPMPLVLGRYQANGGEVAALAAAVEEGDRLVLVRLEARGELGTRHFSLRLACTVCGARVRPPTPALFSFNSPLGACPECQGFGRVIGVDRRRVIPDGTQTLAQGPIAPWNTPAYEDLYEKLIRACQERGLPLDVPWDELPDEVRAWVWSGKGPFTNLDRFFRWLEKRSYKVHVRALLARYRSYDPCPACGGSRLQPEALRVRLDGVTLPELAALSVERFRQWLAGRDWTARQREVAGHLLEQLAERIEVLHRVGLDYLALDRQARTLSGGEAQRIHLAAALGSGLTSTLYVLDEPTIGLHPRDSDRLIDLLGDLAKRGNTVLVVEHDRTIIKGADHIIDLGPAAGEHGGRVLVEGDLAQVMATEASLTGQYLRDRPHTPARRHGARYRRERGQESLEEELAAQPRVRVRGARAHNLRGFDLELPLEGLVAITGVSGSGKSTLVENVIFANYQRARGVVEVDPGECDALEGLDDLADVVLIDQRPLGRSSRSNAVTYVKAYDDIRKLYASTPRARARKITPGHFSFNLDLGRCPECKGTGVVTVDMQFMAEVTVTCDHCQGRRFRAEVLGVLVDGLNIAETLELTVEQAIERFRGERRLVKRLQPLVDTGLGYLRLGQSTSTLSGGEAQRLKLASFLSERDGGERRLFLFDEPTTGLHMSDIDLLYHTLRRLVKRRHGIVVVEHSLELVSRADWIVDLGPGGGVHGGELLYSGPLRPFLDEVESPTAEELRRYLSWPAGPGLAAEEG
jgi:excinuclease ABC subunit A